jgi:hypothetical protein
VIGFELYFEMNEFYEKGKKEALRDITANNLSLKTLGLKVKWFQEWREILSNKCKIEIDVIAGCMVLDESVDYANGYNEISEAEIKKRFGEDILEKTLDEAEAIWKLEPYFPKPFENKNEEMTAIPNSFGWVKCPNCNISFKVSSVASWKDRRHLSCGQKIKIIEIKY